MSMDGRYVTRSHGWRCDECPWMDGMSQGAMDGGVTILHKAALFFTAKVSKRDEEKSIC